MVSARASLNKEIYSIAIIDMLDNFDLNLLRVFDAIWREGQVTRAAQSLGLSQSALSSALKRLRDHLGDPLFIKTRRGMEPTPHAVQLATEVTAVLDQVRHRVLAPPRFDPAATDRWFTLCTSDLGETAFMPVLLRHFEHVAPKVRLRTVTGTLSRRLEALERGEIDLVLGHYPEIRGADVMQRLLSSHGHVCLLRHGHPAVRESRISAADYAAASHAVLRDEARVYDPVEEHLLARDIHREVVYVCSHFLSIPAVVAGSGLIATVPAAAAAAYRDDPRLQVVEAPFDFPRFDVKMYWHRKSHNDVALRWLRESLAECWAVAWDGQRNSVSTSR
jgi:DNA-binding transcriptional LysR family regulator